MGPFDAVGLFVFRLSDRQAWRFVGLLFFELHFRLVY